MLTIGQKAYDRLHILQDVSHKSLQSSVKRRLNISCFNFGIKISLILQNLMCPKIWHLYILQTQLNHRHKSDLLINP